MTPQIIRKEDEDSPPPSTERAQNFSLSPAPFIQDTKLDSLSNDYSIVRALFPEQQDCNSTGSLEKGKSV